MTMRLLIFDPHDRGHYLSYVKYLLQAAPRDVDVTLTVRKDADQSVAFQQQLLPHVNGAALDAAIRAESYRDSEQLFEDFRSACSRHRPDHIWIPSADLLFKKATIAHTLGRWRLPAHVQVECGLIEIRCHRPPKHWRGYARSAWDRTVLGAGRWTTLHTVDPTVCAWASSGWTGLSGRLHSIPDPVEPFAPIDKQAARRFLDIPVDGRYLVSVGVHSIPRKGTSILVDAFSRAALGPTDRLLLAGPLGDDLRRRLQTDFAEYLRSERIVLIDRYLDSTELMHALAAADVVCTPYIDHFGSSAIALQSAQVHRPVLAPHQGWFGDMIPRFGLGTTVPSLDPEVLARAIRSALESSARFSVGEAARRLLLYSDAANFGRLWAARLRERLMLPTDPAVRTWQWVTESSNGTRH